MQTLIRLLVQKLRNITVYGHSLASYRCSDVSSCLSFEPRNGKTCFSHIVQQRCRSACVISTFVVHYLDSIIPLVSISKISRLYLVSVAEHAGLSLTLLEALKTGFLMMRLIYCYNVHMYSYLRMVWTSGLWHTQRVSNIAADWYHEHLSVPFNLMYRNFPKFLDRQVWANSADPDQTAPTGAVWLLHEQSDQRLHCLQFPLHLLDAFL